MHRIPVRARRPGPIAFLICLTAAGALSAQEPAERRVEGVVSGEGFSAIKIAVPSPMPPSAEAEEIAATVRDDLRFSGFFDVVDPSLYGLVTPSASELRHEDWLSVGADALVILRVEVQQDQRIDLEARLYDNASGTLLFGYRYGGRVDLVRRVAHQLSDDLVHHYTGRVGIALSRITFVSKHGEGKEIYLMDYDGQRLRRLTSSGTINLSPAWSPDGTELAFVSWRGRQPGVHVMSKEGKLGQLDTMGGELSSAPEWSPNGNRLAYTSDVAGNTEIYVLDRGTGRNRRLTHSEAIDTAPAFSPNGREIAFTSDRGGTPQIYIMDADGLNVRRVSWRGPYNESAAWSPLGDRLVFASRVDGRFEIVSLDLLSGRQTQLTRGPGNKENPRWSSDGRHIVFASDREGSFDIYTMRADGSSVQRLTRGGDCFTPDWSR